MLRLLRIPKSGRSVIGGYRKTGSRTIEEQKTFLLSPNQAGYEPYWDYRDDLLRCGHTQYTNIELIEAAQRPLVPNVLHAASVHHEPTGIRFGRHQPRSGTAPGR